MPKTKETFILVETAAGFAIAHIKEWDAIGNDSARAQQALAEPKNFSEVVTCRGWLAFKNAEEALENMAAIRESRSTDLLRFFLIQTLPKKAKKYQLGISDPELAKHLAKTIPEISVFYSKDLLELFRYCVMHIARLVPFLNYETLKSFQVGLGHSYSRSKVKDDPKREDKSVQQAISLLEVLERTTNKFSQRVKEWYSWHYPELINIVPDQIKYAQCIKIIQIRQNFDWSAPCTESFDVEDALLSQSSDAAKTAELKKAAMRFGVVMHDNSEEGGAKKKRKSEEVKMTNREALLKVLDGNEEILKNIEMSMKMSMGQEIVEGDMLNILSLCDRVLNMDGERSILLEYVRLKMLMICPNLTKLVGELLGAKLILRSGSLINLAKMPSSTIQILGSEKALFRALKNKNSREGPKTPKFGILFQSYFISKTNTKNKGKMSRFLSNKIALAARYDALTETKVSDASKVSKKSKKDPEQLIPDTYGTRLRELCEQRLLQLV